MDLGGRVAWVSPLIHVHVYMALIKFTLALSQTQFILFFVGCTMVRV